MRSYLRFAELSSFRTYINTYASRVPRRRPKQQGAPRHVACCEVRTYCRFRLRSTPFCSTPVSRTCRWHAGSRAYRSTAAQAARMLPAVFKRAMLALLERVAADPLLQWRWPPLRQGIGRRWSLKVSERFSAHWHWLPMAHFEAAAGQPSTGDERELMSYDDARFLTFLDNFALVLLRFCFVLLRSLSVASTFDR